MIATVGRSHDSTRASRSLETGTRVARYHDHKSLGYKRARNLLIKRSEEDLAVQT